MNYILFDEPLVRQALLPFTFTRPVCEIRVGILTIREKWEHELKQKVSVKTQDYLAGKYPIGSDMGSKLIDGSLLPDLGGKGTTTRIQHLWDIFSLNGAAIADDYERITKGRISATVSKTNTLLGKDIFIEEGVIMECAVLNSTTGHIYIGKNAEVMEGSVIRGPFALGEESVVKAGAKIYGPTTIGPHCKVGGEISNSVMFGYSNKAHDGFMGNSVIGEWCNLGADTNTSNLKNNYSVVSMYDYSTAKMEATGLTFCGLMMGDHSKCGINTMFNTGTVVGVCANIFGGDFPPKFIPSFSWGGAAGFTVYELEKALETATRVYERRHKKFDKTEKEILTKLFSIR